MAENGITALPTLGATATADSDFSAATASTTRSATITAGGSSATETAASSNGNDGNMVGFGAVLAAVGGAALVL